MNQVNVTMSARWIVLAVLIATPLSGGCGAKNEEVENEPIPATELASDKEKAAPAEQSGSLPSVDFVEPAADDEAEGPSIVVPSPDAVTDDGADEVERPRSMFRSIGRAIGKGLTDAARGASAPSEEPAATPQRGGPDEGGPDEGGPEAAEPQGKR